MNDFIQRLASPSFRQAYSGLPGSLSAAARAELADYAASAAESAIDASESADLAAAAASAAGPVAIYDTKAAANAALAGTADGAVVEVIVDETHSDQRTRYRKESGAFVFKVSLSPKSHVFDSIAQASTVFVHPTVNYLVVGGRFAAGDMQKTGFTRVGAEPDHYGKFQTSDGSWWEIAEKVLRPEMFTVASGEADSTDTIRRAAQAALILGRPLKGSGKRGTGYPISTHIFPGSLDATAPAAGTADGFSMSDIRLIVMAGSATSIIHLEDCSGVELKRIGFDLDTQATTGTAQLRLTNVDGFVIRDIEKIAAVVPATSGGSAVSLQAGCRNGEVDGVRVENAGSLSAAVFCIAIQDVSIKNCYCDGGQEVVDLSGCLNLDIQNITGRNVDEVIDVGNSSYCRVKGVRGYNVAGRGISIKTEAATSLHDLGSNDNVFEDVIIDGFAEYGIFFGGGTTTTQRLDRNIFRNVLLITTTATASTVGVRLIAGDVAGAPTRGTEIHGLTHDTNDGKCFELADQLEYKFIGIRSNAPTFATDGSVAGFAQNTGGLWQDVTCTGDFSTIHRGLTVRQWRQTGGKFNPIDGIGNRYFDGQLLNCPGDGVDLSFTNATTGTADKDLLLEDWEVRNCSLDTGTHYVLRVRHTATSGPIERVRIVGFRGIDDQGTPTSGGANFGNATIDRCRLIRSELANMATNVSFGFVGLNSVNDNDNNRMRDPVLTVSGSTSSLIMQHAGAHLRITGGAATTIPPDSTTAFPIGTEVYYEQVGSTAATFVSGAGVTFRGGTTATTGDGTGVRVKKTAANTYLLRAA